MEKPEGMEETKETRISKGSGTSAHKSSETLAGCTGPLPVCASGGLSAERRRGYKFPSLTQTLSPSDNHSQRKKQFSYTDQGYKLLLRAGPCSAWPTQNELWLLREFFAL